MMLINAKKLHAAKEKETPHATCLISTKYDNITHATL
jgi:hypothetical protein